MCSLMPLFKDPQMVMKNNLPPEWKPQLGKVIITFLDADCPQPEPFPLDRKDSGGHRGHPEKTSTKPASPRSRSWETPQRRAMLHLWLFSEFIWPKYSRTESSRCHFFHSSRTTWQPWQTATPFVFDHPRTCFKNGTVLLQIPAYLTPQHQRGIKLLSGSSKTKYPGRKMEDFREGGKQLASKRKEQWNRWEAAAWEPTFVCLNTCSSPVWSVRKVGGGKEREFQSISTCPHTMLYSVFMLDLSNINTCPPRYGYTFLCCGNQSGSLLPRCRSSGGRDEYHNIYGGRKPTGTRPYFNRSGLLKSFDNLKAIYFWNKWMGNTSNGNYKDQKKPSELFKWKSIQEEKKNL